MANIINGVIKFYDKETESWVVPTAKPIKELVIEAMEEDFLNHKGEIGLLIIELEKEVQGPKKMFIAYDTEIFNKSGMDATRMSQEIKSFCDMYAKDKGYYPKTYKELVDAYPDLGYYANFFGAFDCVQTAINLPAPLKSSNLELNNEALEQNAESYNKLTISYVFNDHAIEGKQFKMKQEE